MTVLSILLRASVVLGLLYLVHAVFAHRMSAAMRHFVWTLAVVALLLLPVLSFVLPGWTVVEFQAPPLSNAAPVIESPSLPSLIEEVSSAGGGTPTPVGNALPWLVVLSALYAAVTGLLVARLIVERQTLQRLAGRSPVVDDPTWTELLAECRARLGMHRACWLRRSTDQTMPMTFGIWRPTIVIPSVGDTWSPGRRRTVLLHELAHVARWDCLTQTLAAVVCAFYWIHPMVWWVARRLRVERELACDDRVLTLGAQAREYAGDLLDLAYTLGSRRTPALAVSMAGSPQIEGRMLAVLDETRIRTTPAWPVRAVGLVLMIAMLVPAAVATTAVRPVGTVSRGSVAPLVDATAPAVDFAQQNAAASPTPQKPGTWELRTAGDPRTAHLRLSEGDGSYGFTIDIDQLNGLSTALLSGAGGSAQFTLRRDAGAFQFEGIFRNGVGAGTYTFAPSPDFAAAMEKRGLSRPTPAEQYLLARANFSFAFLDELNAQGYARPDLAQLIRALQHGVSLSFVREMGQLGYRLKDIGLLVTMRDHGVSPQYVREMVAEGLKGLSSDDLVRARDHGVSPEYVREMRTQGYQGLSLDELIRQRDHGVSPAYLRELAALGYAKLALETVLNLRNHGVSPEYVRDLRTLGYQNLTTDGLIRLRNHGVSPDNVRALNELGYKGLTTEDLVRLRDHGVSSEYVRALNELGYKGLTVDDLVGLRNYGVSPERIRTANERAGQRLTVDALKSAAANGWR